MRKERTDPQLVEVWMAMADHFLDTETRHDIPRTAMACLEAGLPVARARDVWRYEVSPAVGFNVWDVAGEWAGWDQDWLVERIERLRRRWDNTPGTARWLRYRVRVHFMHGVWLAIERCMEVLLSVPEPEERRQMAKDLTSLARHYFDFCPSGYGRLSVHERSRLSVLYPEPFRGALDSALVPGEHLLADRRVRAAFEGTAQCTTI